MTIQVQAPPFALYPEARHWWSLEDYGAVLGVMRALKPKRVLEFGPGSSTLALIEGGAKRIDTCEDNPDWFGVYKDRLQDAYPDLVTIHAYEWSDDIRIPSLNRRTYDLALIDGPYGTEQRPASVAFALQRSKAVLVPTEDHGREHKSVLRPILAEMAAAHGFSIDITSTGPLSGGFALLQRKG